MKFLATTILGKIETILPFKWQQLELLTKGKVKASSLNPSRIDSQITNHPVHIVTEEGTVSPSAFIPFCELAGDMSVVGTKLDKFDVPVCNSFKAKILNDQLCYEIDVNEYYIDKERVKRDPKHSMGPLIVIFRQILQSKHVSKLGTDAAFMYCRGLRHSETKIPS